MSQTRIEFRIGKKVETVVYQAGDSLLDTALRNGLNPPYSCLEGVCATCKAKVISGKVDFPDDTILPDSDAQLGMVLTCQAKPAPGEVLLVIDYDAD